MWGIGRVMAASAVAVSIAAPARADQSAAPCPDDALHCMRAPIAFDRTESLPIEWSFDTGWVPASSPLQLHLSGGLAAHTRVALAGELVTSWGDEAGLLRLRAPGAPGGGLFGYDYGIELGAEGKIDLKKEIGWSWQGKLPVISNLDLAVASQGTFDAWGWAPGVSLSDKTGKIPVAKVNLLDLVGAPVPGFGGGFEMDVALEVGAVWLNERIVIDRAGGQAIDGGPIAAADGTSSAKYLGGAYAELDVHPEGKVTYTGTLHLLPTLYVQALLKKWKLPLADLPVSFPITDKPWVFPPVRVHVPLPDLHAPESIDFGRVAVGQEAKAPLGLENAGEAAVSAAMGVDEGAFQLASPAAELAPKGAAEVELAFAPKRPGKFSAVLHILSNDPDQPVKTVSLQGEAVAADGSSGPPVEAAVSEEEAAGCACSLEGTRGSTWPGALALAALALAAARRAGRSGRREG